MILQVGPRPSFETAWSTTAVSICQACGLNYVTRIERSLRVGLDIRLNEEQRTALLASLHDRMTEMPYEAQPVNFNTGILPAPMRIIPLLGNDWRKVLRQTSVEMGLGLDEQDIEMIGHLFVDILKRNLNACGVVPAGSSQLGTLSSLLLQGSSGDRWGAGSGNANGSDQRTLANQPEQLHHRLQ